MTDKKFNIGDHDSQSETGIASVLTSREKHQCKKCGESFPDTERLRGHKFEHHPFNRPILVIRDKEVGSQTLHINRKLNNQDVAMRDCNIVILNGEEFSIEHFPEKLSVLANGTYNLRLENSGVSSEFTLEIKVASDEDIKGIENTFREIVVGKELNPAILNRFIEEAKEYESAMRYCDGISSYLYGVLLKEGSTEIKLAFEDYVKKFNAAAEALADYQRPLGRLIISLISFHFNHFSNTASVGEGTMIGWVASQFIAYLDGNSFSNENKITSHTWEELLADNDTKKIINLTAQFPNVSSIGSVDDLKTEYDRAKVHLILSESSRLQGKMSDAINHAKHIRNLPLFEGWADNFINKIEANV